jgi:hypothetical protein
LAVNITNAAAHALVPSTLLAATTLSSQSTIDTYWTCHFESQQEVNYFYNIEPFSLETIFFRFNLRQSYDIEIMLTVAGSNLVFKNTLDLKNPFFRYTGQTSIPPGQHHESPTEQYYQQLTTQANTVQQQSHQMQQVQPQQMHESKHHY